MASAGGLLTNAGYGCTCLSRLVARRPDVTAYVTANDRFVRTGPHLFVTQFQDINSSILRRSGTGVGQATDAADTRARRLSRGGATRARVGEAAPAAARSWRAHATCRRHVQPLPASVLYGTRAISPSAVTCRPAARQPCTRARRCRKSTCRITVCGGVCEKSVCKGEPLPWCVVRGAALTSRAHA